MTTSMELELSIETERETFLSSDGAKSSTNAQLAAAQLQQSLQSSKDDALRPIDFIFFFLFLMQTSSATLLTRYSKSSDEKYSNAAIIGITEIGKMVVGILYCFYDYAFKRNKEIISSFRLIFDDIFADKKTLCLMSVPALVYSLQNFLMFLALGLIDSSIYQIVIQLKTFMTACFGMCLLNKKYSLLQWVSFALLSVGVIIANYSVMHEEKEGDETDVDHSNRNIGLLYVLGTTVTSGFAGTFMEMQLKDNKANIFVKNIQLSIFSLFGCFINACVMNDISHMIMHGFFYGFNHVTWIIVLLNVFGGYFVAIIIRNASIIIKTFLSGIAILLIIAESYLFLGDQQIAHQDFMIAVLFVLFANYLYNREKQRQRANQ